MTSSADNSMAGGVRVGDKLDKYEVVEQIGAGGMSVVWKGYDRLLDRHVAIKQILPDGGDGTVSEERVRRFRSEAAIQKRLAAGHKHLVKVIDFVEDPRGLLIVMEYVDGLSLEQVLAQNRKPMDYRQALGIVGATALGLETIHRQGVIHRDLKPSNILLPRSGGLKVADFGLAAVLAEQDVLSLGSVRYMAPELFREEMVDERADLYSLGMIAYEMLAGREHFEDAFKIVLRDQRNQALRWMKWHTNPRAKAPTLAELGVSVPASLSELVERMMEKEPAKRVGSAGELVEAIRRHFGGSGEGSPAPSERPDSLHGGQTATGPATDEHPTAALPRRGKLMYVLGGILVAQVLLAAGVYVFFNQQDYRIERHRRDEAVKRFEDARTLYGQDQFAKAQVEFEKLATQWPQDQVLGVGSRARALLSQARQQMRAGQYEQASASLLEADRLGVLDRNLLQDFIDEAQRHLSFERETTEIERLLTASQFSQARERLQAQRALRLTADEKRRLEDLGSRIEDQQTRAEVAAKIQEARKLLENDRRDQAIRLLTDAQRRYDSRDIAAVLTEIDKQIQREQAVADGRKAEESGDLSKAVDAYRRAIAMGPETELDNRIKALSSRMALAEGRRLKAEGDLRGAEAAFTRALGFMENPDARQELDAMRTAGQKDLFVRAGDEAAGAGQFAVAIQQYENALKLGPDEALTAKILDARIKQHLQMGQKALEEGNLADARAAFKEAQRLSNDADTTAKGGLADIEKRAQYLSRLEAGDALRRQSKFGEAKLEYDRAQRILNTPEVAKRIEDVEYDSLIANARRDMAARNWSAARAWILTAARRRNTPQLEEMLAEVDKNEPAVTD